MKNTVEEYWFENSSQNSNYIEITEDELTDILDGQEINRQEREGKEIEFFEFRLDVRMLD